MPECVTAASVSCKVDNIALWCSQLMVMARHLHTCAVTC